MLTTIIATTVIGAPGDTARKGALQALAGRSGLDVRAISGGRKAPTSKEIYEEALRLARSCGPGCELAFEQVVGSALHEGLGIVDVSGALDERGRKAAVIPALPWLARGLCRSHRAHAREHGYPRADLFIDKLSSDLGNRRSTENLMKLAQWADAVGIRLETMQLEQAIRAARAYVPENTQTCHDDDGIPDVVTPAIQVMAWHDGGRIDRLVTPEQFAAEGNAINHCIGGDDHESCEADGRSGYFQESRDGTGAAFSYRKTNTENYRSVETQLSPPQGTVWVHIYGDTARANSAYGFGDGPIHDTVARERLVRFLCQTPGAPSLSITGSTTYLDPYRTALAETSIDDRCSDDEDEPEHDEDGYDEDEHDEPAGVPQVLPADLLPEMPAEPQGPHAQMLGMAYGLLTQAVNELRTRLNDGTNPADALAAPTQLEVPFPGGPYPNWFVILGSLESCLRGRYGIQGRQGAYIQQQRPWDEDNGALAITMGAADTSDFELLFDPIFDPSSNVPGLQNAPVVPAWLRNRDIDSLAVRLTHNSAHEAPNDILIEIDLYHQDYMHGETQATVPGLFDVLTPMFTAFIAGHDAGGEPDEEDEPAAIEATDEPPVFDDATIVCGGCGEDVLEAESNDGLCPNCTANEDFGAIYGAYGDTIWPPSIILVPPNTIFEKSSELCMVIGHEDCRKSAIFVPYLDDNGIEHGHAWTVNSRDRAIELFARHELRELGLWPNEDGSLFVLMPAPAFSPPIPGNTVLIDSLLGELMSRFPGGLAIALDEMTDSQSRKWTEIAKRNEVPVFDDALEAIESHRGEAEDPNPE